MSTKNNNNNNDSNKTKKGQAAAAAAAVDRIDEAIAQQQRKRHEMETLIGHTVQFVAARMESENQIGAVLSMKQLLKYEAQKEQIDQSIAALHRLVLQVNAGLPSATTDVAARIATIVDQPVPACTLSEKDDILEAARLRLEQIGVRQETATGRAA